MKDRQIDLILKETSKQMEWQYPGYETHHIVQYYECDPHNRMKVSHILRLMQQISSEHLDKLGGPYEFLYAHGMVFLVSQMTVKLPCRPQAGQKILLRTYPHPSKGARMMRSVLFYDLEGKLLVQAMTSWMLVNPESRKILRPSVFPIELNMVPCEVAGDIAIEKIPHSESWEACPARPIRFSDIDCNGHVNNAVYADMAFDCLPTAIAMNREPKRFCICYHNEAKLGDTLAMKMTELEKEHFLVQGAHREQCFEAEIDFAE